MLVNASDESHSVRALRKSDGEEVWRRETDALDQCYGVPLIAPAPDGEGAAVAVVALLGEVWGLDPSSGDLVWSVKTLTNGALAPTATLGDGVIYSLGGQTRKRSYAIRLGGDGDVSDSHVVWSSRYGSYVATPLLHDGHLYWVSMDGIAHCQNAATGELVYKERLGAGSRFYASPVRAGGAIYAVSREAGTYVLPAAPRFEVLAHNRLESDPTVFDGTPAISGGRLFLRSRTHVYCIGAPD